MFKSSQSFDKIYCGILLMEVLDINKDYKQAYKLFMDNELSSIFSYQRILRSVMHTLVSCEQYNDAVSVFKIFLDRNGHKIVANNKRKENFFHGFLYLTKALHRQVSV